MQFVAMGDGVACCQRVDVVVREKGAVVYERRAQLGRKAGVRSESELVAVRAQAEAGGCAGLEAPSHSRPMLPTNVFRCLGFVACDPLAARSG